jgi:MarR family 2-MHQ and catechol resistance regulon transcriptional repressor
MGTRYTGTKSEMRALNAYIKFLRASESVTARLTALVMAQTGLTISQFGVLESLLHLGPMCQKEIAQKQLKSGGNMTLVIDNLEKRKMVRRERSQVDRRLVIVNLTSSGKKLISNYFPKHAREIEQEMSPLTATEQDKLAELAKKLGLQTSRQ